MSIVTATMLDYRAATIKEVLKAGKKTPLEKWRKVKGSVHASLEGSGPTSLGGFLPTPGDEQLKLCPHTDSPQPNFRQAPLNPFSTGTQSWVWCSR